MEFDTKTPPVCTSDKETFAYISALERWPVILTGAIDDLHRSVIKATDEEKQKEGKEILHELAALKYELQHGRKLTPLADDGESDITIYNKELADRGELSWFDAPWLFAECYLYRRMSTHFALSKHWKEYDVFAQQKMSTFRSSRPAVLELATRYKDLSQDLKQIHSKRDDMTPEQHQEADKVLFTEMCEICLWGNATDLSLLTSLTYEDIQKLQGAEARKKAEANVLVNDLPAAFELLNKARTERKNEERRVDIVLDNAGFELFVDLILAGYLLSSGLATCVVLHPKSIPWFVSDVLPRDFGDLIALLSDPQSFFSSTGEESGEEKKPQPLTDKEVDELKYLFQQWGDFHAEGQLIIRPNRFWTTASSYWRLPHEAPSLYEDLKESELVIFKGDLNYRKLTADAHWDPTTPFDTAIGPLGQGSGVRVLALRTCKADVVVGLEKGEDERLRNMPNGGGDSGSRKWAWSGKWAVVSLCDGKKKE
ncbi:hypothetical protein H112_04305 [Trichophyton rubrum D6]|uniref:Sugar phosphate phosphatase n=5 Tax=Trichophyton TaxID=5550 RepID=A0A178F2C1_TRIRU|nr:uncharacterized protein TERG_04082 [Trichophyton rubrum CBS 118892]EZF22803.1 hypothetical protein H100_04313 [Trichophyton rubrum MR850]EZF42054.1 hypothetical protein H102_04297 [Trichophyton rubrum CBS 100081]EZF52665.1 hypothetical protein H103_04306 [Trichophyton rubrum CBS 288.86]EZF63260.1 hypothetical protein H104_04295 [Trichophyton rubrum CBS 289.86]EZF73993.1 hypothetical protein H105_04322 [Trichophyton soudanense CBS 452.61]EZF84595.1 hypothetical protein H110_04300 [Trichophy